MKTFSVQTHERVVFVDITAEVEDACRSLGLKEGAALVYVPHTTAGVTINENADPSVCADLRMMLDRLVPESLPFTHIEGNADAHAKASLIGSSVLVPVEGGRLQLGTWQAVFFAEFDGPRRRRVVVSALPAGG